MSKLVEIILAPQSRASLDAYRNRVKVGFCGRSSSLDDFEFVASLLCVAGAALSSVSVEIHGRRDTLELFVQILRLAQYFGAWARISWQARHFDSARSLSLWRGARGRHVTLTQRDRSRCGAVHILSMLRALGALAVVRCEF